MKYASVLLVGTILLAKSASEPNEGRRPVKCAGHEAIVTAVALSPDGKVVVSGSDDQTLRFWDTTNGQEIRKVQRGFWIGGVRFSPDGKYVATTASDSVRFWDPATGKEIKERFVVKRPAYGLAFSADGSKLAVAAWFSGAEVWDTKVGRKLHDFRPKEEGLGNARGVAISPDGSIVAAALHGDGGEDSRDFPAVRVWEAKSGKEVFKTWAGGAADAVAFSPSGKQLAIGGMLPDGADHNGVLEVWNLDPSGNTLLFRVRADQHGLFCLAFSPDGKTITTGGTESVIKLWNAVTGELLGKLEGHSDQVHGLAFSADGRSLVSGGRDKLVLIWPMGDGRR
jgi:dipeptidyl aminopeptidase/acylaminoacyl peptidase